MVASHAFRITLFLVAAIGLAFNTGCVGPMACGPDGSCGPVGVASCDGCDECDGCGELYIDPWINHPADCCDPCDACGNYNGQSCGKCRPMFAGFPSLWGYRCDSGPPPCHCGVAACDGGCDAGPIEPTCGLGCDGCDSCCVAEPLMPPPAASGVVRGEPTPAEVVEIKRAVEPYRPHRERKIFRDRPDLAEGPPDARDY